MHNSFFNKSLSKGLIPLRVRELSKAKVGFYSIGLYPASLAYNCAMQTNGNRLLLAPRPGRDLFGAFSRKNIEGMDPVHIETMKKMSTHLEGERFVDNTLSDLILRCEIVVLSSNSNHIENDLSDACKLRKNLNRENVVLACLAGSFSFDNETKESYVLCEKVNNLAFFSGFHRHDALRNPLDSFTANFCHPNALTAMLGATILDTLSPNIQVSSGIHNVEGQYIKAAKNISSVFAGFGYRFYKDHPGLLPTLLTLLLNQCLDQASSVSVCRNDREKLYDSQSISLTELGYGVQRIEAALLRNGELFKVRDHTFSQLTAMVADVRGSMMKPVSGKPTRNFMAGEILADRMKEVKRCPLNIDEFIDWCEDEGLKRGGLEGIKSLRIWPQIQKKYGIPLNDASMNNLMYMIFYSPPEHKNIFYNVLTQSRELTNYCQESVRPKYSRRLASAFNNISDPISFETIVKCIESDFQKTCDLSSLDSNVIQPENLNQDSLKAINIIESYFK